jgi:SAM-dependent methyltransferase
MSHGEITREMFEQSSWDERYGGDGHIWSGRPNAVLAGEAAALTPGRAVDLGCGEGGDAIWLAERGWQVTAVDFSEVGVDKGRQRNADVDFRVADVLEFDAGEEEYDLVVVFYLQLPADELERVLRKAARAVAPGGTFLLVGHDLRNLTDGRGGPKDASVLYRAEELPAALEGLEVERAEPVDRDGAIDALVRAKRPAREPLR